MTAGRLLICRIPDDFDPSRDTPVAPWCLAGREHVYPNWETLDFPDPWPATDDLIAANGPAADLCESMTAELAQSLAASHGVTLSSPAWRLLLARWVLEVTQTVWVQYHTVQAALAKLPRPLAVQAPPAQVVWAVQDIPDFYSRCLSGVDFHAWVAGLAARILTVDDEVRIVEIPLSPDRPAPPKSVGGMARLRRGLHPRCEFGGMASEYDFPSKLRSLAGHLAVQACLALIPRKVRIRARPLAPDTPVKAPDGLVKLLRQVVDAALPQSLDIQLPQRLQAARAGGTIRPGRLSIFTAGVHMDDKRLYEMVARIDDGEGMVYTQHGGNYGVSRALSLASRIEYAQHAFITWGWESHGGDHGHFLPLPAPMLAPWRDTHREQNDELVLIGRDIPFVPKRLDSLGEFHGETTCRRNRLAFLAGLSPELLRRTIYRPYPASAAGLEDETVVRRAFPDLGLCHDSKEFFRRLRHCRLAVVDHPGTSLYMALAAGIPVVAFWNPKVWPMVPEFEDLFGRMRHLGIVHDDGTAAARQAHDVWNDTKGWWQSAERQDIVRILCRRNARTSPFWPLHWMKALWTL